MSSVRQGCSPAALPLFASQQSLSLQSPTNLSTNALQDSSASNYHLPTIIKQGSGAGSPPVIASMNSKGQESSSAQHILTVTGADGLQSDVPVAVEVGHEVPPLMQPQALPTKYAQPSGVRGALNQSSPSLLIPGQPPGLAAGIASLSRQKAHQANRQLSSALAASFAASSFNSSVLTSTLDSERNASPSREKVPEAAPAVKAASDPTPSGEFEIPIPTLTISTDEAGSMRLTTPNAATMSTSMVRGNSRNPRGRSISLIRHPANSVLAASRQIGDSHTTLANASAPSAEVNTPVRTSLISELIEREAAERRQLLLGLPFSAIKISSSAAASAVAAASGEDRTGVSPASGGGRHGIIAVKRAIAQLQAAEWFNSLEGALKTRHLFLYGANSTRASRSAQGSIDEGDLSIMSMGSDSPSGPSPWASPQNTALGHTTPDLRRHPSQQLSRHNSQLPRRRSSQLPLAQQMALANGGFLLTLAYIQKQMIYESEFLSEVTICLVASSTTHISMHSPGQSRTDGQAGTSAAIGAAVYHPSLLTRATSFGRAAAQDTGGALMRAMNGDHQTREAESAADEDLQPFAETFSSLYILEDSSFNLSINSDYDPDSIVGDPGEGKGNKGSMPVLASQQQTLETILVRPTMLSLYRRQLLEEERLLRYGELLRCQGRIAERLAILMHILAPIGPSAIAAASIRQALAREKVERGRKLGSEDTGVREDAQSSKANVEGVSLPDVGAKDEALFSFRFLSDQDPMISERSEPQPGVVLQPLPSPGPQLNFESNSLSELQQGCTKPLFMGDSLLAKPSSAASGTRLISASRRLETKAKGERAPSVEYKEYTIGSLMEDLSQQIFAQRHDPDLSPKATSPKSSPRGLPPVPRRMSNYISLKDACDARQRRASMVGSAEPKRMSNRRSNSIYSDSANHAEESSISSSLPSRRYSGLAGPGSPVPHDNEGEEDEALLRQVAKALPSLKIIGAAAFHPLRAMHPLGGARGRGRLTAAADGVLAGAGSIVSLVRPTHRWALTPGSPKGSSATKLTVVRSDDGNCMAVNTGPMTGIASRFGLGGGFGNTLTAPLRLQQTGSGLRRTSAQLRQVTVTLPVAAGEGEGEEAPFVMSPVGPCSPASGSSNFGRTRSGRQLLIGAGGMAITVGRTDTRTLRAEYEAEQRRLLELEELAEAAAAAARATGYRERARSIALSDLTLRDADDTVLALVTKYLLPKDFTAARLRRKRLVARSLPPDDEYRNNLYVDYYGTILEVAAPIRARREQQALEPTASEGPPSPSGYVVGTGGASHISLRTCRRLGREVTAWTRHDREAAWLLGKGLFHYGPPPLGSDRDYFLFTGTNSHLTDEAYKDRLLVVAIYDQEYQLAQRTPRGSTCAEHEAADEKTTVSTGLRVASTGSTLRSTPRRPLTFLDNQDQPADDRPMMKRTMSFKRAAVVAEGDGKLEDTATGFRPRAISKQGLTGLRTRSFRRQSASTLELTPEQLIAQRRLMGHLKLQESFERATIMSDAFLQVLKASAELFIARYQALQQQEMIVMRQRQSRGVMELAGL